MLVGFKMNYKCLLSVSIHAARLPRITTHPQQLIDAVPGGTLTLTVKASGTEPLNYQWEIKTGDGSGVWQSCDVERFPGANSSTLTIPSMQKPSEGSYRCTVSNCAGSEISECVTLTVGKNCCEKTMQFFRILAVLTVEHTGRSFSLHCL